MMAESIIELPILTNSRKKSYQACPRQHYYGYTLGYRPCVESEARSFGTHMHAAWEAYWNARKADPSQTSASQIARFLAAIRALPASMDPFLRAKAEAVLVFYTWIWDHKTVTVLAVEVEFAHPLINPETGAKSRTWRRGGKMDVVLGLEDGRVAVNEHKTTSEDTEPGSIYRQKLSLDGQVSEYFDGGDSIAQALGYERIDTCIYDIAVKPQQRPYKATPTENREYTQPKSRACAVCKKIAAVAASTSVPKKNAQPIPPAPHRDEETGTDCIDGRIITDPGGRLYANMREFDETPAEYFDRIVAVIAENPSEFFQQLEVSRLEQERDEYLFDVWQYGALIRESERLGRAPKNTSSCFLHNSKCDFWGVCTKTESITDPYKFRRAETANEELVSRNGSTK